MFSTSVRFILAAFVLASIAVAGNPGLSVNLAGEPDPFFVVVALKFPIKAPNLSRE